MVIKIRFLLILSIFIFKLYATEEYFNTKIIYSNDFNSTFIIKKHTLKDNNISTKEVYINLPKSILDKYQVQYYGGIELVNENIYQPNGLGYIRFIRKSDGYFSLKQKVNSKHGVFLNKIKISANNFYKCLDNKCFEKEYKGTFNYLLQKNDKNKTTLLLKRENYIYKGMLEEKNQSLVIDGLGELNTTSGTYFGEFKDFKITGYGTFKTTTNNLLNLEIEQSGLWQNGHFKEGYLSTIYQDGGFYKGYSLNGVPNGRGIFIWPDKSSYTGNFKNGKKDGFGTYTFSDGSIYTGNYKNDEKHGYGELYIKSKNIYYKGQFKNGKFEGEGELHIQDKITYIGKFKNNMPVGKGIILDQNGNITKVIIINGYISPLDPTYSFFDNFPFTKAYAGWFSDKFKDLKNGLHDAVKWVVKNHEHIVNALKGCVAGGLGGGLTGATSGAVVGAVVGVGVGTGVGMIAGGLGGALNGCINQAGKAYKISKSNNGHYTWKDAKKASVDEISVENAAVGAIAGFGAVAGLVERGAIASKSYEYTAVVSRILVKTPRIQKIIKNLKRKIPKICKIKFLKKNRICSVAKIKVNLPSKLSVISWNLKNLSAKSANRDWNTIKKFINSKSNYDFILLQEIMNKKAISDIKGPFLYKLSKEKGLSLKKEYYGFLINKKYKNKTKLVEFRQYKQFIRSPSALLVDNKFALINVHIIYGSDTIKGKFERIKEIKALIKIVKIIKKKYKINNIIIAGDFNIDFDENIYKALQIGLLSQGLIYYINEPTTIGNLYKNRFNKKYDHFFSTGISRNASVEKNILFNRKQIYFNKKVSDHLPISGTFIFNNQEKKKKKKFK
jgi:endonuclease/exonuclease/phosphatase family metal-dependent hydrolase